MKIRAQIPRTLYLTGLTAVAFALGSSSIAAGPKAAAPERPYGGSCDAVVIRLTDPGVFPEILHVDLDCTFKHMGRVTGEAITTVYPTGELVGTKLPITLTSETTYEAANGHFLDQTFAGTGEVDVVTLEVTFEGTETLAGGTGRFANAVGVAHTDGSASFVTNQGFLTTKGTLAY